MSLTILFVVEEDYREDKGVSLNQPYQLAPKLDKPRPLREIDVKYSDQRGCTDLVVMTDGRMVVTDLEHKLVKVFSPDGQLVMTLGPEGLFYPSRLCLHPDQPDSVLISDDQHPDSKVLQWNITTHELSPFIISTLDNKLVRSAMGITCSLYKGQPVVLLGDYVCEEIRIFDISGKEIESFWIPGDDFWYIASQNVEDIIVVNHGYTYLSGFRDGKRLWCSKPQMQNRKSSILKKDVLDVGNIWLADSYNNMVNIAGMCILENGNILLTDSNNQVLLLYSKKGRLLGKVLTEEDGLNAPHAVEYNKKSHLLVILDDVKGEVKIKTYEY
jgi:hypothetical protein